VHTPRIVVVIEGVGDIEAYGPDRRDPADAQAGTGIEASGHQSSKASPVSTKAAPHQLPVRRR
jgi:hypothetical protein